MSGELNTDNTDATGFSQMAVVTAPLPCGGARGRVRHFSPFSIAKIRQCHGARIIRDN